MVFKLGLAWILLLGYNAPDHFLCRLFGLYIIVAYSSLTTLVIGFCQVRQVNIGSTLLIFTLKVWQQQNGPLSLNDICHAGIRLAEDMDQLYWGFGNTSLSVTTRSAYDSILDSVPPQPSRWWYVVVWKLRMPVTIKCFIWLALHQKILMGDKFRLRGGNGPSVCQLCFKAEETVDHIFSTCPITLQIWEEIICRFKIMAHWNCAYYTGFGDIVNPLLFPSFLSRVWRFRNSLLFDNLRFSFSGAVGLISHFVSEASVGKLKVKPPNVLTTHFKPVSPTGYFDGAEQGGQCGARCYLFNQEGHFYELQLGCGSGSNSRAELLACWLLQLAHRNKLKSVKLFGDSSAIIGWLNGKQGL